MSDLQPAGVELIAEGGSEFIDTLDNAGTATDSFASAADLAAGAVSGMGTVVIGALLEIGSKAVDALLAAGGAVVDFAKESFESALDAEQSLTRISTLIEATGGAAGVTLEDAQELATGFMDLAGGSDDAILAIEEMALRMGTVSSDEMPTFIQTTLDLAAATGQDAVAAARTLARAQEDPVAAYSQLRRQGILLTQAQEDQMKSMAAAGDTAGAYALLMDRVSEATEGAAQAQAETLGGKLEILQGHISEAGETIMTAFIGPIADFLTPALEGILPLLDQGASLVATLIEGLLSGEDPIGDIANFVYNLGYALGFSQEQITGAFNAIIGLRDGFAGAQATATAVFDALVAAGTAVVNFFISNWPLIQSTAQTVFDAVGSVISSVSGLIFDTILPAIGMIVGDTTTELPSAQAVFESVMAAISIGVTAAAEFITGVLVPAITAAVDWFVTNWPAIQATTEAVFAQIQAVISSVMEVVEAVISAVLTNVAAFWTAHGDSVMSIVDSLFAFLQGLAASGMQLLQDAITAVLDFVSDFWTDWGDTITEIFNNSFEIVGNIFDAFAALFKGDFTGFGEEIRDAWDGYWASIQLAVENAIDLISAVDWGAVGSGILEGIAAGITAGASFIAEAAQNAASAALEAAKAFLGISSPSKKAEDEVGLQFGRGIAAGTKKSMSEVIGASSSLAGALFAPPAFANSAAAAAGATYNDTRSAAFGDVHINSGLSYEAFKAQVTQIVQGLI